MREYADEAEKILTELEIENQLPCLHLVTILDVLMECSVMDFSVQFMSQCTEIEKFVNASLGKDPAMVLASIASKESLPQLGKEVGSIKVKGSFGEPSQNSPV